MSIVERIKLLAKQNGTDLAKLERTLGISNGVIRRWDTASPTCEKIMKVAEYFSVSVDSLLYDKPSEDDAIHKKLLNLYDNSNESDKLRVINYLELVNSLPPINKPMARKANIVYSNSDNSDKNRLKAIPIRGYVAAGVPIEAIENNLGTVPAPNDLDADYALIVNGNSMDPIIKDNEPVYVKAVDKLDNDDIGVFYYNGSVTCKKFFKDDLTIKLISLNPDYEDFIFYLDDSKNEYINFTIEGKVLLSTEQAKRFKKYFTLNTLNR